MHSQFTNTGISIMQSQQTYSTEWICWVSDKCKVPIKSNFALAEGIPTKQIWNRNFSTSMILLLDFGLLSINRVESPVITSVVDCKHHLTVPIKDLQHSG